RRTFATALNRELAIGVRTDPQAAAQLQAAERLLDQAIKDGQIIAESRPHWLKALREDRNGAKACLAVMQGNAYIAAENAKGPKRSPTSPQTHRDADLEAVSA